LVRLDQLADIRTVLGPIIINREEAHRRTIVMSNVKGRDLGSFVKDAETNIQQKLQLPAGYRLEWGGQYENQKRAQQRLAIVFPVSILIISALLHHQQLSDRVIGQIRSRGTALERESGQMRWPWPALFRHDNVLYHFRI
jgi:Cu/Ag efflux pump CusA